MSAIASFFLLEKSQLDDLLKHAQVVVKGFIKKEITDTYWDYLGNNAIASSDFDGSDYVFPNMLFFLEEKNVYLLTNDYEDIVKQLSEKRESFHCIFTYAQKEACLTKLDEHLYSLAEIQQFNKEFSEQGDIETAEQTLSAIKLLHDNLAKIENENQILLLFVG